MRENLLLSRQKKRVKGLDAAEVVTEEKKKREKPMWYQRTEINQQPVKAADLLYFVNC